MYRRDRTVVPEFDASELLFLRYSAFQFVNGQLTPDAIRDFEQSVNRQKFSEPEDVLFSEEGHFNGLGVVEFAASVIPSKVGPDGEGKFFYYAPRHRPLDENYSHSEIWASLEPDGESKRPPRNSIALKFRTELSRQIREAHVRIKAIR